MSDKVQRFILIAIAVLFLATSVVGIYALFGSEPKSSSSRCGFKPGAMSQVKEDETLAGTKLANFTPVKNIGFLKCEDFKIGSGAEVKAESTIVAHYIGAVASTGVIFQSSLDNQGQPFSTTLDRVIPGWTVGLQGMKAGGERRLYIPAEYAYGPVPPEGSGIPPNADLVFDVAVLLVQ
jgi:FKBP-type peptidyl-prolyl cis-trans isomerase